MSDKAIVDAYNKQLRVMNPGIVFLAWSQSGELARGEITMDELIDGLKAAEAASPVPTEEQQ
jgi:hypothetical protein